MSIVNLRDVWPLQTDIKIRVRVCRLWRGKTLKPVEQDNGLHCVLVDQQNDAIHALVKEGDYEEVSHRITKGNIYEIAQFHTKRCQQSYKIVPHSAQIWFNNRTIFDPVENVVPPIPQHKFYLMEYNQLYDRIDDDYILTDILGRIKSIQPVEEVTIKGRPESRCYVHIQNIRKENIRVTLWGGAAHTFEAQHISQLNPPVLAVFTSLRVKEFQRKPVLNSTMNTCTFINPNIPDTVEYKKIFSQPFHAPRIFTSPTKQIIGADELEAVEKKTVKELNLLDPETDKETTFFCRAAITKFITRNGWYYKACPVCYKQLKQTPDSNLLICSEHSIQTIQPTFRMEVHLEDKSDSTSAMLIGKPADVLFGVSCQKLVIKEGHTEQNSPPKQIFKSIGQFKIWQITLGNRDDLVIKAVYPDIQPSPQKMLASATPEHQSPSKRALQPPKDSTQKELFKSEPRKKQKSFQMASSYRMKASVSASSSSAQWKYDVFLSFRGEDTRKKFTDHLYDKLQQRGIKTFRDDPELEIGATISPELLAAVEKSRFAVVVISPNYASSTSCLLELAKIVQCMGQRGTILPIFYEVVPSDVRHQRGSFAEAFGKHEEKFGKDLTKVQEWRDALTEVADLFGWISLNYRYETELIKVIVEELWKKVHPTIASLV